MEVPDYLQAHVGEAVMHYSAAQYRRSLWASVFGLDVKLDGNRFYVLLGENIQEGVCGFGDTPYAALMAFERAMDEPAVSRANAQAHLTPRRAEDETSKLGEP